MRFKTHPLLLLALLGAGDAAAIGLGEIAVLSRLGERFRAEVQLIENADENRPLSECFRLSQPVDPDTPALTHGRVTLVHKGGKGRLLISSEQTINDPVLQLNLRAGCGTEIVRNYSVLIDPAAGAFAQPSEKIAAGPSAAQAPPYSAPPVPPAQTGQGQDGDEWQAGEGESARSMLRARFPRQNGALRRWLNAVRAANPEIDLGPRGEAPLPAGTRLRIPELRPPLSENPPAVDRPARTAAAAPDQRQPPRDNLASPRAPGEGRLAYRLVIAGNDGQASVPADELSLRLASELSTRRSEKTSEGQRAIFRVEYKLLAALYDRTNEQLNLAEQVRNLESSLAELHAATENGTPHAAAPVASPVPPAEEQRAGLPPLSAQSRPAEKAAAPTTGGTWWLELAALLGLIALLAGVLRYRALLPGIASRKPAAEPPEPLVAEKAAAVATQPNEPQPALGADDTMEVPATLLAAGDRHLSDHSHAATVVTEGYEFNPVMELAEIMISFGRVKGAAQALQEYIAQNPYEALQPWLKLLDIYRQGNMREDFESLSEKLKLHFNVAPVAWDAATELPQPPAIAADDKLADIETLLPRLPNIAQFPHIGAELTRHWNSPGCLAYLNNLLRDNRNGERQGFGPAMVGELLFLIDLLDKRLKD